MPFFGKKLAFKSKTINEYSEVRKFVKNGVLVIPENYETIGNYAFSDCRKLKKVIIGDNIRSIGMYAFSGCRNITEVQLPHDLDYAGQFCFAGCKSLEKITTPISRLVRIGDVFKEQIEKMKYIYQIKGDDRFVLSVEKPVNENVESIVRIYDFCNLFRSLFSHQLFGFICDYYLIDEKLKNFEKFINELKRADFKFFPFYLEDVIGTKSFSILANADLRYFKNEFSDILVNVGEMKSAGPKDFYKFALAFGCFSNKKMIDNQGRETDTILSHKACYLLAMLMRKNKIGFDQIKLICESDFIEYPNPSQEFLKFIAEKGPNDTYPNLELLLELEKNHKGLFAHTMAEFHKAKNFRHYFDKDGHLARRPWKKALIAFYDNNKYLNVTEDNKYIAKLFSEHGISQKGFDRASEIFMTARRRKISSNILNKPIKEETILDGVERIKKEIQSELGQSDDLINKLFDKQFTYEMLDKQEKKNAIIGIFASCCSHVDSELYGGSIARAAILEPDVQNMVVRDNKGEIIAKGTLYLNRIRGYAVINEFEINEEYKKDEDSSSGYYEDDDFKTGLSRQRKLIFDAFMRGIKAFVKEYDTEHPCNPIKKVNVGFGYNRLKKLCAQYQRETDELHVPADYEFIDAREEQYILYDRSIEVIDEICLEKKL